MYLLDTNVLSATAPTKTRPDESVRNWIRGKSDAVFLSVVTLLELSYGLDWLHYRGATQKAGRLKLWIDTVFTHYSQRLLPVDPAVALRAGALLAVARGAGVQVGSEDAIIGATAELHGFTILTTNERHFAPMGVAHLNPFRGLPQDC